MVDGITSADPRTELRRWRLLDERGRQTWQYLSTDKEVDDWPQTLADKYHLGLPLVRSIALAYLYTNADITISRTCLTSQERRHLAHLLTMAFLSSPINSFRQATGHVNTVGRCFFYPG